MRVFKFSSILILFFCLSFSMTSFVSAEAGFALSPIWYSKDSWTAGDTVSVFTVVFNTYKSTLTGNVSFFDGSTLLSKKSFTITQNNAKVISFDWKVTAGDHRISAKISDTILTDSAGKKTILSLADASTPEFKKTVAEKIEPKDSPISAKSVPTSNSNSPVSEQISDLQNTVSGYIPESVKNIANSIDTFRKDRIEKIDENKIEASKELEKSQIASGEIPKDKPTYILNASDAKPKVNLNLKNISYYAKYWLYSFLSFVFHNAVVFYGLVALIIFFIIKFMRRKSKN